MTVREPFICKIGCSHHDAPIDVREQFALSPDQVRSALTRWSEKFGTTECVLLSTCNRTEWYIASESVGEFSSESDSGASGKPSSESSDLQPSIDQVVDFICAVHNISDPKLRDYLEVKEASEAAEHLFNVAASLDSMVVGEAQVLSQVKQAYQIANEQDATGPLLHSMFQAGIMVARRIVNETLVQQRRVSIPSVAVADFAQQIFERLDDKNTLVIGAGEMGEETLRYLRDEGAVDISVINRSSERARDLARNWQGRALAWEQLDEAIVAADLVISTTGASEPIMTAERFAEIDAARSDRPLFILDLAIPRDFDPAIGDFTNVYLYSIDDLQQACSRNRELRNREMPRAQKIVHQETEKFIVSLRHRATGPLIQRLRDDWQRPKDAELRRLLNKLPELDSHAREEIERSFDRLVNKLLHPPLESLRDESKNGVPHGLLDALARLFKLRD
jgi:glutamyl-tRNA reductase